MATLVLDDQVRHKLWQVEYYIEDAADLNLGFAYDDRVITPTHLEIFFDQYDEDPVVATKIRVNGPVRKKRGVGYLKSSVGEIDYGAYWLSKDRVEARMKERNAPAWLRAHLLDVWPYSL